MMRILLVEDDHATQNLLKASLIGEHFLVDAAEDGEIAWDLLQQFPYDLVLLDVVLPRLDGITLCRRLRQTANPIPVMLLTTRSNLADKVLGLESGADDYVTKPFHLKELIARIHTIARRHATPVSKVLTYDHLELDPTSRQITYAGQILKIGRKEYLILELLLRHPHQVFSRYDFIDRLWSLDEEIPTEATVKSHIRSIRRKLEPVGAGELIETLYGQGYRLNPALIKPTVTPPLSTPDVDRINTLTTQVWQRAYSKSLDKIGELEQAIAQLQTDDFIEATRQQAIFTAHKLAGSMHIFGFELAAQLLQQIEDEFRQAIISPEITTQLLKWTKIVRLELAGQQSTTVQLQTSAPSQPPSATVASLGVLATA